MKKNQFLILMAITMLTCSSCSRSIQAYYLSNGGISDAMLANHSNNIILDRQNRYYIFSFYTLGSTNKTGGVTIKNKGYYIIENEELYLSPKLHSNYLKSYTFSISEFGHCLERPLPNPDTLTQGAITQGAIILVQGGLPIGRKINKVRTRKIWKAIRKIE